MESMEESLPVLKGLEEYRQEDYWLPPGSFAWFLGISPPFYQRIIGGMAWVSEQTQRRIAARLGVTPDQILEFRVPEVPAIDPEPGEDADDDVLFLMHPVTHERIPILTGLLRDAEA